MKMSLISERPRLDGWISGPTLTHSKQYISPPFGPYPSSLITSERLMRSRISMLGAYSKDSAAGSKLTRCPFRFEV